MRERGISIFVCFATMDCIAVKSEAIVKASRLGFRLLDEPLAESLTLVHLAAVDFEIWCDADGLILRFLRLLGNLRKQFRSTFTLVYRKRIRHTRDCRFGAAHCNYELNLVAGFIVACKSPGARFPCTDSGRWAA